MIEVAARIGLIQTVRFHRQQCQHKPAEPPRRRPASSSVANVWLIKHWRQQPQSRHSPKVNGNLAVVGGLGMDGGRIRGFIDA